MSTLPTPVAAQISTPNLILSILTVALQALAGIPVIGADAQVAAAFIKIIQSGVQAYQQNTGMPLDLTKIPLETPVP